jgi:hypothetical protein
MDPRQWSRALQTSQLCRRKQNGIWCNLLYKEYQAWRFSCKLTFDCQGPTHAAKQLYIEHNPTYRIEHSKIGSLPSPSLEIEITLLPSKVYFWTNSLMVWSIFGMKQQVSRDLSPIEWHLLGASQIQDNGDTFPASSTWLTILAKEFLRKSWNSTTGTLVHCFYNSEKNIGL